MSKFDFITGKVNVTEFSKENLQRCEYTFRSKIDDTQMVTCDKPASVKYTATDKRTLHFCDACDAIINNNKINDKKLNKQAAKDIAADSLNRWLVHEGFVFDRDRGASVALLSNKGNQSPFPQDIAEKIAELLNSRWKTTSFSPTTYSKVFR